MGQSHKWGLYERENPGVCYEYGHSSLYLAGGRNFQEKKMTTDFRRFDVNTLKWKVLPDMKHPRYSPGVFMSKDKKFVYVFGGQHGSIERIETQDHKFAVWQEIQLNFP